ncbi:hypothetical protein OV203_11230 [Nannocystis sp. ILAH1]|uniref:hypothetical protein n=1 Tax=unclassified Nannocystis TaxID=2627009 RepID=UPI00226E934E|nr:MULTISPECIES: hypothetical protein [unclassified Nannocystis]MCY0987700.1 hypothetical protein [Nannocystis sp. ILAH1]MCY1070500.1 hypothetical protein [Nannocystis sp. RBIL2]
MLALTHEPVASLADDERRVLAARAAVLVLGVLLVWPIVAALVAGLEYASLDLSRGAIPTLAERATLTVSEGLARLVVMLLLVRRATQAPRADARPLSLLGWLALALLVAASVGAHAALVWLPARVAEAIGALGVEPLAAWLEQTTDLTLLRLALDMAAVLAAFIYAVVRWQSAQRRLPGTAL